MYFWRSINLNHLDKKFDRTFEELDKSDFCPLHLDL